MPQNGARQRRQRRDRGMTTAAKANTKKANIAVKKAVKKVKKAARKSNLNTNLTRALGDQMGQMRREGTYRARSVNTGRTSGERLAHEAREDMAGIRHTMGYREQLTNRVGRLEQDRAAYIREERRRQNSRRSTNRNN